MTKEITMCKKRFLRGLALVVILSLLQNTGFVPGPATASGTQSDDIQPVAETTTSLIINEFVASNLPGLLDEDGDASDWIELYNAGATAVNLAGWSLTDASGDPWVFPA